MLAPTAILFAIVPFTIASACTKSIALAWPFATSGGSEDACASTCKNDSACLSACYKTAQAGQCAAAGCSDSDKRRLMRRDNSFTLTCTGGQTCYQYTDGSLLCLDLSTGNYVDDVGGNGNANSGVYTAPNGQITTNLGSATATATATGTNKGAATSLAASSEEAASSTALSASSTQSSSAETFRSQGGTIMGMLGLILGFAL